MVLFALLSEEKLKCKEVTNKGSQTEVSAQEDLEQRSPGVPRLLYLTQNSSQLLAAKLQGLKNTGNAKNIDAESRRTRCKC